MTKLEDRLRSDLRAMAQQAQPETLRPLRAPAAGTGRAARSWWLAGGRPGSPKQRWLAAVAAVAAVAVIVAAVNIAGRLTQHRAAGPVAAMPRYYLDQLGQRATRGHPGIRHRPHRWPAWPHRPVTPSAGSPRPATTAASWWRKSADQGGTR